MNDYIEMLKDEPTGSQIMFAILHIMIGILIVGFILLMIKEPMFSLFLFVVTSLVNAVYFLSFKEINSSIKFLTIVQGLCLTTLVIHLI